MKKDIGYYERKKFLQERGWKWRVPGKRRLYTEEFALIRPTIRREE
jgi:hypothetical protein